MWKELVFTYGGRPQVHTEKGHRRISYDLSVPKACGQRGLNFFPDDSEEFFNTAFTCATKPFGERKVLPLFCSHVRPRAGVPVWKYVSLTCSRLSYFWQ